MFIVQRKRKWRLLNRKISGNTRLVTFYKSTQIISSKSANSLLERMTLCAQWLISLADHLRRLCLNSLSWGRQTVHCIRNGRRQRLVGDVRDYFYYLPFYVFSVVYIHVWLFNFIRRLISLVARVEIKLIYGRALKEISIEWGVKYWQR